MVGVVDSVGGRGREGRSEGTRERGGVEENGGGDGIGGNREERQEGRERETKFWDSGREREEREGEER